MRSTQHQTVNDQLQAWLRTLTIIGTIAASVFTAGMHFEHRLTVLEDGQVAIAGRLATLEAHFGGPHHK